MRRIILVFIFLQVVMGGYSQSTTDPTLGAINVNTPKTPESSGFEKFGKYDVNEFTGTANISIPIYTLSSRHLSVPISLDYHPTGIRVSQEASWVGLGWDLTAGGRITVETRGSVDFATGSVSGNGPSATSKEMQRVQRHFGTGGDLAIVTFPSFIEPDENGSQVASDADSNLDILAGVQDMDEFGTGEPDIFRANFMGHSFNFYFDKITGAINFIGEKTLFNIIPQFDAHHITIAYFEIVDNQGVQYYFGQTEVTTQTNTSNPVVPPTTVTAWLLTSIVHPDGDYINFTYANYGYSVPALDMVGSFTWTAGSPAVGNPDTYQWPVLQSPQYLTKIETASAAVNFNLATRTDLYGPGSRELSSITITDKTAGLTKKTVTFYYGYFQGTAETGSQTFLNSLSYSLPSPLSQSAYLSCNAQRLRLDSVSINLGTYQPPYRFTYFSTATLPDKYSQAQDHWGFYNGTLNGSSAGKFYGLIPINGQFGVSNSVNSIPSGQWPGTAGVGLDRDCDSASMSTMTLRTIGYPTGGSTSFVYEPHQSTKAPNTLITGGGLRIKTITNYSSTGNLLGSTNYSYVGGKYMGMVSYMSPQYLIPGCRDGSGLTNNFNFSSVAAKNDNEILIGYAYITSTQTDANGNPNGSVMKTFNISTPSSSYYGGVNGGVPYYPPQWDTLGDWPQTVPAFTQFSSPNSMSTYLDPIVKNFPPTPASNLEGKLMQEQYFDNKSNLVKSISYYYHLANYSNNFYSVRAIQNRVGGFNLSCQSGNRPGWKSGSDASYDQAVIFFISPAKAFFTLKDSVVEVDYSGGNALTKKTTIQYNAYYQPMFETVYNSDGTQTIHYTRTSAEIYVPQASAASGTIATQMYQMLGQHALDLPIEQVVIHRGTAGDSTVISSKFNVYNKTLPLQVYVMESPIPLTLRTQFVPWSYTLGATYSVTIDPHYSLYSAADYSPNGMIWTLHTLQGNKAFIWDENYNLMMAQCNNADSANVAFSSFETAAAGRWVYNPTAVISDNTAPTGSNVFALSGSYNISLGSLSSSTTYVVSYWSKTGSSYIVSGSTATKQGKTINGWTYFEHTVTGVSTVTISGTGSIDEVRLYPSTSQMISYTYSPLIGITSQCDADNRITYYFYDGIGRLKWIKDQDGNIVKTFQYHYQSLNGLQY